MSAGEPRIDAGWLRRAYLRQVLDGLKALQIRRRIDNALSPAVARRRFVTVRGWALRKGDYERYLSYFGSHERLAAFHQVAARIRDDAVYWRCLRGTWTGDDAPGLHSDIWAELWLKRPGREHVMLPEERAALAALPDPIRVWRGTARAGADAGWSWTTDAGRAVWFARWHADNQRVRVLYGVLAQGSPMVLEGLVARDQVLALLSERGEGELIVPPESVQIERMLPWDAAAAEYEPDYLPSDVEILTPDG